MLSTEKISRAFEAICEEAENLKTGDLPDPVKAGLSLIISIARHQNDIRSAPQGSCKGHPGKK